MKNCIILLLLLISNLIISQVQLYNKCVYRNNLSYTGLCYENTYDDYALILYDEFDRDSLNYDVWQHTERTANGVCNDNSNLTYFNKRGNVTISNGILNLALKYEPKTLACQPWDNPQPQHNFLYSGGWLESVMHYAYGKYEVKFRVPEINYANPAFWLYDTGPGKNEIDVFEFFESSTIFHLNNRKIKQTVFSTGGYNYWPALTDRCELSTNYVLPAYVPDFASDFHIATVEWTPDHILWKIDGITTFVLTSFHDMATGNPWECSLNSPSVLYRILSYPNYTMYLNNPDPYYMTMQLILDIGQFGSTSPNLPAKFEIDYIKAWSPIICNQTLNLNGQVNNPILNLSKNDWVAGNINCSTDPQGMLIKNHHAGSGLKQNCINLVASDQISFLPGFGCEEGAYMSATISPCDYNKNNRQNTNPSNSAEIKNINFSNSNKQTVVKPLPENYGNYIPFPNPTGNKFKITNLVDFKNSEMSIYNSIGEKIIDIQILSGDEDIDLMNFKNGVYLIKINGLNHAIRISKFE